MKNKRTLEGRTVGLDLHPDLFTAGFVVGRDPATAQVSMVHDRLGIGQLEKWAQKNLRDADTVVMEASGNSFEVARRLHQLGFNAVVVESCQLGQVRKSYCNNDKLSAVKIARGYLTGLTQAVWQPDQRSRQRRELLAAYQKSVQQTTRLKNRIRSYCSDYCLRLPRGARLTQPCGRARVMAARTWDTLQKSILESYFEELHQADKRRKTFRTIMAQEVAADPNMRSLLRLLGIREVLAFALMAIIGDIHRFANPKKLVAYLGLCPKTDRSGKGIYDSGLAKYGRRDLRSLLVQVAQNAMNQKNSPLHSWGWKLFLRTSQRNLAVIAVARKLAVSIWYLLQGHFSPLTEVSESITTKLVHLATLIGKKKLQQLGYASRTDFVEKTGMLLFESP